MLKLIASDLDGTLLDGSGQISAATIAAIRLAQSRGIVFAICTGRFAQDAAMVARDAGIDCPIISLNGGYIQDAVDGKMIAEHAMPPAQVCQVQAALEEIHASYFMFGQELVATRVCGDQHHSLSVYGGRLAQGIVRYTFGEDACRQALSEKIFKFYIYGGGKADLLEVRKHLQGIADIELTQSSEENIEVMPLGVNKGQGLKQLAAYYQIDLADTMAIGDQENDLPMLQIAGIGVAMGNASPQVRQAADEITAANREDGVAQAILRHLY